MEQKDREMVLMAMGHGPLLALRLSWYYLRLRHSALGARKRFYRELRKEGLPKAEAQYLTDEYDSAISLKSMLRLAGEGVPLVRK